MEGEHLKVIGKQKEKMGPKRLVDVYSDRKYFCEVCNIIVGSTAVQHHRVPHLITM